MLDRKTKKKLTFYLATKFGWLFILALGKTLFIKEKGKKHLNQLIRENKNYIYALWHGRIIVPIFVNRNEKICPMVSLHADGEMIAQTMQRLGFNPVRGSSTRGGKKAFHDMVNTIKQGVVGAMIPDGPTGPRHKFKPGTLYLAQQAEAYLIPTTFSANRKFVFKSWDRFVLPKPFSKNLMLYGKPLKVPKNISAKSLALLRADFEQQMINLERQADEYFRK